LNGFPSPTWVCTLTKPSADYEPISVIKSGKSPRTSVRNSSGSFELRQSGAYPPASRCQLAFCAPLEKQSAPPLEVIKHHGHGNVGHWVDRNAMLIKRTRHPRNEHGVSKWHHLGFDRDVHEMFHGANARS